MKLRSIPTKSLLFRLSSSSTVQSPRRPISVRITNIHFSTFSTTTGSSGSGSTHSSHRRQQYEEESRSVRVSVWWDFGNCNLPVGANVFKVAQYITAAIRNSGIKGPISITAFGDVLLLPRSNQDALSATGISLTHVPQGGKNSADRSLITDLMCWVSQNPPPAHLFLISSDREFASVLHRLRMSNYNILLASKSSAPGVLCSAASIMWDWDGLIKGDNVIGKYFNQPPDGPYNSWYGHYRIPLLDPFGIAATTTTEQSSSVKTEQVSESCSSLESVNSNSVNIRPVPKEVANKIRLIVSLYPKGVAITELRAELSKRNLANDKDFYGHKKFSRFLLSMPDILQVGTTGDGLFIVRAVTEKSTYKRLDSSPGLTTAADQKTKEKENVNASSPKLISDERRRDDSFGKVTENEKHLKEEAPESSQEPILVSQKDVKANNKPVENQVALIEGNDSSLEDGFFQKLKRLWFGSLEMESVQLPEKESVSGSGDEEKEDKDFKSSSQGTDSMSQTSPSFVAKSVEVEKEGTGEVGSKDEDASPGILSRFLKNFKFWGNNAGLSNDSSGNPELVNVDSQVDDIFAKGSFWTDVESFINSPRGFAIVSHSRTRELMAMNLQKEGPSCLRLLDESSMLHLVNLLISQKKWIEENPSSSLPFSIIKGSSPGRRYASNGLSSIFSDCSKSQSHKQNCEKRVKNVAHSGVSVGSMDQKQLERYKSNALADCQKLIKKITEENPEGYSLIRFRKDFLEEYGYHLAVDKLGYENLQSLIQVMHGVKIASGYILPLKPSPDGKSIKEDDSDLSFEELGPVSEATSNHPTTRKLPVYEPSLSEDEDSGSERDNPEKKKQEMSREGKESSLLQILDSYYTNKDEEFKKEKPEERKLVSNGRKQKPAKTYSFVKDSEL
ncbi:hypothetical protein V5N11_002882 [Cardamine amara subsp. amara]|uniref:HTH OST-type domain-containing protein n=1 Tax=Cardamine amara subsp. amara TaxID=228776 RepID=A0ABD1BYG8_CARAN